jgi:RHS repeat-associated protein
MPHGCRVEDSFAGVLTSVYDNANRLTSRQFGGSGQTPLRIDLAYSLRNEVTTMTRYSDLAGSTVVGTSVYAHDDAGRLTSIDHKNGSATVLASYVYAYDNADRLTNETINGTPHTYSYDSTSQLTGEDSTNYSYDANGNRTMSGYQTGVANRLSNDGTYTYTYDDAGNLIKRSKGPSDETWTYAYDHNNHLISVEKRQTDGGTLLVRATYTYAVQGRRIQDDTWQSGSGLTTTRFSYDPDGNVWADLDGSSALVMRYLWTDGLTARVAADGTPGWLLTDRLGTIRGVTNGSGTLIGTVTYDAFGKILSETSEAITGRFAHAGLPFDRVVQIVRADRRDRLVYLNVWMQEDPILFGDGPHDRLFVHNNPTNLTDPIGLAGRMGFDRGVFEEQGVVDTKWSPFNGTRARLRDEATSIWLGDPLKAGGFGSSLQRKLNTVYSIARLSQISALSSSEIYAVFQGLQHFLEFGLIRGVGIN